MHRFFANQPLTHSHKTKSQISSNCLLVFLLVLSCLSLSNLYSCESNNSFHFGLGSLKLAIGDAFEAVVVRLATIGVANGVHEDAAMFGLFGR